MCGTLEFLERLAQVLKAGKKAACQRAIKRLFASMTKRYEDGEYESSSQAEFAFRTLVDEPPKLGLREQQ